MQIIPENKASSNFSATPNLNNVDPGTSSSSSSYAPGEVVFTITVANIDYVETAVMLDF